MTVQTMTEQTDEVWLERLKIKLRDGTTDPDYANDLYNLIRQSCIEYAETAIAVRDARIVALEAALDSCEQALGEQ